MARSSRCPAVGAEPSGAPEPCARPEALQAPLFPALPTQIAISALISWLYPAIGTVMGNPKALNGQFSAWLPVIPVP